jgi:hypothetical protein
METTKIIFAIYLFLAVYCAGSMTVLQLQHFALYPKVGPEYFKAYLQANNKAAVLPAIMPALLLLLTTLSLLFVRPTFMPLSSAVISFGLNVINVLSTAIWQGKLHAQLAVSDYEEGAVQKLVKTNWIRTAALLIQALISVTVAVYAMP